MNNKPEDSLKWSVMLGITVILAGVAGYMVVNRYEFFPSIYRHSEKHQLEKTNANSDSLKIEEHSDH
jgi:hypothetical protein